VKYFITVSMSYGKQITRSSNPLSQK